MTEHCYDLVVMIFFLGASLESNGRFQQKEKGLGFCIDKVKTFNGMDRFQQRWWRLLDRGMTGFDCSIDGDT